MPRLQHRERVSTLRADLMQWLRRAFLALPGGQSPVAHRLARGGFWSMIGDSGARILAFLGALAAARLLGVEQFGQLALVQGTVAAFTVLAQFGLGQTTTRYVARHRADNPEQAEAVAALVLRLSLAVGLISALLLFFLADIVAGRFLASPELATPLRIVAPVLFCFSVYGALVGAVQGLEAFSPLARQAWINGLISFLLMTGGIWFGGLIGAAVGMTAAEAIKLAMMVSLAKGEMARRGLAMLAPRRRAHLHVLWTFSLPMLLGSLLHAPVIWLCYAIVAHGPFGAEAVGLYDAAQKWMTVVMLVPFGASAAIAPVLASLGAGGYVSIRRTTRRLALLQFVLTVLPAALVAILADHLVLLFGSGFAGAADVIRVLMLLAPVFVLRHLYWQALASGGRAWLSFTVLAVWAVIAVLLTWLLLDRGAIGLAMAMTTAYGVSLVVAVVMLEANSKIPFEAQSGT